jgi:chromosome partitioning protein
MGIDANVLDLVDLSEVKRALRRRLHLIANGQLDRKVIVVINGKGGVGKSSVSAALAAAFAKVKLRVLLVEMDEQGNNDEDLGYAKLQLSDGGEAQAAAILDGKPLVPTGQARPNLFVVPGGEALEDIVEELYCQRRMGARAADPEDQDAWMGMYARAIDAVRDEYDVILLDVAPGSQPLQLQALTAGDMVLIPARSDLSSRKGLRTVGRRFRDALPLNPALRLLGVIVFGTGSAATRVQAKIKEQLASDLKSSAPVLEQTIRHVEAAAVACRAAGRVPQEMSVDPKLPAGTRDSMKLLASDYRSLSMEILQAKADLEQAEAGEEAA